MAGAAPDNNAGVPAPRCPGAQRPGIAKLTDDEERAKSVPVETCD
jgi:hypothetical protein